MKTYIKPVTTVSELLTQQPLATSGGDLPSTPDTPGIKNARYRNTLWEDDDDNWLEN